MNKSYFYIETAFHHEGNIDYLKELIDNAKQVGVDGVKFQVLTAINDFVSTVHTSYDQLSKYCFTYEQWSEIFDYTKSLGLDIILMPLNVGALKLIEKFEIKYLDIHSVSFNDVFLLEAINQFNTNIILAIGGRDKDEIEEKLEFFKDKVKILMVGFQSFPSKLEDINLGKITWLKKDFSLLQIGYADHSSYEDDFAISSNEYARLLGAEVFEKHVSMHEGVERVDYNSAISFQKMKIIIDKISFIEKYVLIPKDNSYIINEKEEAYKNRQLVCVAKTDIEANTQLRLLDISFKMVSDVNNCTTNSKDIVGRITKSKIESNQPIRENDLM